MPFYRINTDLGICGTDDIKIIEADCWQDAESYVYEELTQSVSAVWDGQTFDTEDEAKES